MGIRDANGFSSVADEIIVAYSHFEGTVIEPKRKKIITSFGYILKLSGYNIKINVIPNKLITLPEQEEAELIDTPDVPEAQNINNTPQE